MEDRACSHYCPTAYSNLDTAQGPSFHFKVGTRADSWREHECATGMFSCQHTQIEVWTELYPALHDCVAAAAGLQSNDCMRQTRAERVSGAQ
jgi:hypothetical protein